MMGLVGFVFWSAVVLAPALFAVAIAAWFLRRDLPLWLAPAAVAAGFLAGGIVGWASVPAEWTASFWTTIDAAGNAARYGHSFEHAAEHTLMYFLSYALLGELVFGLAGLVVVSRLPDSRSARP